MNDINPSNQPQSPSQAHLERGVTAKTTFTAAHPPPSPPIASFAEAILAVLLLGYVVEVNGNTDNPEEDSTGGAIAILRDLGWPLQLIPVLFPALSLMSPTNQHLAPDVCRPT